MDSDHETDDSDPASHVRTARGDKPRAPGNVTAPPPATAGRHCDSDRADGSQSPASVGPYYRAACDPPLFVTILHPFYVLVNKCGDEPGF